MQSIPEDASAAQDPEEAPPSLPPVSDVSSTSTWLKIPRCHWIAAIVASLMIIVVGGLVGWGAARAWGSTPTDSVNSATNSSTDSPSHIDEWVDANEFTVFGDKVLVASQETNDRNKCFKFCSEYPLTHFKTFENLCECYLREAQCWLSWGDQVDSDAYKLSGFWHSSTELKECNQTYCEVNPASGLCLTQHKQDYQKVSLFGTDLNATSYSKQDTIKECLDFCGGYDGASFLNWKDCTCYSNVDCWLEYGQGRVNTDFLFGMVFSKSALNVCSNITYCDVKEDGPMCFSSNTRNYKEYSVYGANMIERTSSQASSEKQCLEQCAPFDAAQWMGRSMCKCYDQLDCWLPWDGDRVDTSLFFGSVYSKTPMDECSESYCDIYKDDELCLTANKYEYKEYTLFGGSLTAVTSNQTQNKDACLELCAPYAAAAFSNFKDCTCYSNAECLLEWGSSVDTNNFYGSIYSKTPLDKCSNNTDYCKKFDSGLCFTANSRKHSQFSLGGAVQVNFTTKVKDPNECLEFCQSYPAASFLNFEECTCYSTPGGACWQQWGELVDSSTLYGFFYSKSPLDVCADTYCSSNQTNDDVGFCLTGNSQDYKEYSLSGGTALANSGTKARFTKDECLEFCSSFDAVRYWQYRQPSCTCYESPQCWLPWGNETNTTDDYLYTGRVYSNRKLDVCL